MKSNDNESHFHYFIEESGGRDIEIREKSYDRCKIIMKKKLKMHVWSPRL